MRLALAALILNILGLLLTLAAMLLVLWQFVPWAIEQENPPVVLALLAAPAMICPAILVHEAGHLVAAWWARMQVVHVEAGPLGLVWEEGPGRLRPRWCRSNAGVGVVALPRDAVRLRRRYAAVAVGGPLAGAAAALVCLLLAHSLYTPPPRLAGAGFWGWLLPLLGPTTTPVLLLNLLALANVIRSAASLYPVTDKGSPSDAGQLLLLCGGPEVDRQLAMGNLLWRMRQGLRPRHWEPGLAALLEPPEESQEGDALLVAYYHAYDNCEIERAGRLLDRAVALLRKKADAFGRPDSLRVELAYFTARHRGAASQARGWLQAVTPGTQEEHTLLRAEAAVLLAEDRPAEAFAAAEKGLAAVPRSRDAGGSRAERDWLEAVLAAARRALEEGGTDPAKEERR
jgi:hypothetical protein